MGRHVLQEVQVRSHFDDPGKAPGPVAFWPVGEGPWIPKASSGGQNVCARRIVQKDIERPVAAIIAPPGRESVVHDRMNEPVDRSRHERELRHPRTVLEHADTRSLEQNGVRKLCRQVA